MTEVLKALQDLNVVWKKIGHYNMKCRWTPGIPCGDEGMVNNSMHGNHYFEDDSSIIENDDDDDDITRLSDVVKFEVQVGVMVYISSFQYNLTIMLLFLHYTTWLQLYKTREDKYLLDLQRVQGPQLLFLDLCAAFLAQLRVL